MALIRTMTKRLSAHGLILIGDVMTQTHQDMRTLADRYEAMWDEKEHYPVVEHFHNALAATHRCAFKRVSHCSGIMHITPMR